MKTTTEHNVSKSVRSKLGFSKKNFTRYLLIVINSQLIYAFVALRAVLYEPLLDVLGLTNTQFGSLMGIIGFITVFGGLSIGWLQDKFPVRNILSINTIIYGSLTLILALFPGIAFPIKCLFFISFGFNADAFYWATVLKSVRGLAKEDKQATAFGFMEGIRACVDLCVNALAVALYTFLGSTFFAMKTVLIFNSSLMIFSGIIIWLFIPKDNFNDDVTDEKSEEVENGTDSAFSGFKKALKSPEVWLTGLGASCIYATFVAVSTYSVPYLQNVYLLPVALVGVFGIINGSVTRLIIAPLAGLISDAFFKSSSHLMRACYAVISILFIAILVIPKNNTFIIPAMILLLLIAICCGLVRSVYYAPIGEAKVPTKISAAAMSVAACIGYSPSFWAYPVYGFILDKFSPETAYMYIFGILLIFAILGIFVQTILGRRIVKKRTQA